jgi:hypothetical protein
VIIIQPKKLNKKQLENLFDQLLQFKYTCKDTEEFGAYAIKLLETYIDYI